MSDRLAVREAHRIGKMPKPYFTLADTPRGSMRLPTITTFGLDEKLATFVAWSNPSIATFTKGAPQITESLDHNEFSTEKGRLAVARHIAQFKTMFHIDLAAGPAVERGVDYTDRITVPTIDNPNRVTLYINPNHIADLISMRNVYVGGLARTTYKDPQTGKTVRAGFYDSNQDHVTDEEEKALRARFGLYKSRIPSGNKEGYPYQDPNIALALKYLPQIA